MASNEVDETVGFENRQLATTINAKNVNLTESNRTKKNALGDIKNAPSAPVSGGKSTTKKVETEIVEEEFEREYASSKPVDYFNVWVEKATLTDDEIDRWITMLNVARTMNQNDDIAPPPKPKYDEDIPCPVFSEVEFETLVPPPMSPVPGSPVSDSSDYHSCNSSVIDEEENAEERSSTPDYFNDPEISALNQSVFEFSSLSDDDEEL